MTTQTTIQLTSQGLLITHPLIQKWRKRGVDIIYENSRIIVQPKQSTLPERKRILQILKNTGLLVQPNWQSVQPVVADVRRAKLADKFGAGRPLSEILVEERASGW